MVIERALATSLVALTVLLSFGCTDKAEADYKKCEQAESSGKFEEALAACQAASAADPRSPAGELATKKTIKLYDKVDKARKAKVAEDARAAEQAKLDLADSKVQWRQESTPPKDPHGFSEKCMEADRAYENSYSCTPKDPTGVNPQDPFPFKEECLLMAAQRGCKPMHPDSPSKMFCCTK